MQEALLDEITFAVDNELPPLFEDKEELSLNENDRKWISGKFDAVQAQFDGVNTQLELVAASVKPRGWKRMLFWLREWGLVATNITVILTLIGFLLTAIYAVVHRDHDEAVFETKTDGRLTDIEKTLANDKLGSLSFRPVTPDTPRQVAQIVESTKKVPLDPLVVSSVGQRFVMESDTNPDAWKAASLLLQYKSVLNADSSPSILNQIPYRNVHWTREDPSIEPWEGKLGFIPGGEGSKIAEIREIGDESPKISPAPSYVVLNGGSVDLDGMYMKRVIVSNAHVIYRGEDTHLDAVYFVNCTFEIQPKPRGQLLATAIFSDPATTFAS